ncbi:MAG: RNB domain-containing ribonuclease, partial [Alphaproteobacteria bacterium]|nr:RNB domain-containing ribonuclease [Alphaproteobacteria bacterium]
MSRLKVAVGQGGGRAHQGADKFMADFFAALITIDPADARDHDDAIWAEPDPDPDNKNGWHVIIAIADVSHYVTPGSALEQDARARGNSTYFPDRVVPMLPEALSNGLCSLK